MGIRNAPTDALATPQEDQSNRDALTRSLSSRLSRRTALQATGLAGATGPIFVSGFRASAQEGTATPDPLADDASFLFVQSATSGTFAVNPGAGTPSANGMPAPGGGADYLLTLEGHTGNTVYFSDRPERIFGEAPTDRFLAGLGFSPDNPPNAALVTNDEQGNEDILVVELLNPDYDTVAGSVTYGVNLVSDYEGGLDFIANRQRDDDLAPSFGTARLFIDDCPDGNGSCSTSNGCFGNISFGNCWSWSSVTCNPCESSNVLSSQCNAAFSGCADQCVVQTNYTCPSGS